MTAGSRTPLRWMWETKPESRVRFYLSVFDEWEPFIESRWSQNDRCYVLAGLRPARPPDVRMNAQMLTYHCVMAEAGRTGNAAAKAAERHRKRVRVILSRLLESPPWTEELCSWGSFDGLATARYPHPAASPTDQALATVYLCSDALDLDEGTRRRLRSVCKRSLRKYCEEAGTEIQPWVMRAAAYWFLATGDEDFWQVVLNRWDRIIERTEDGKPIPFFPEGRSAGSPRQAKIGEVVNGLEPDYGFVYGLNPVTNRYDFSTYSTASLAMAADVVRIARLTGRSRAEWERFISLWSNAVLPRALMRDGSMNMAVNSYGFERYYRFSWSIALHGLVSLGLAPMRAGQIKWLIDSAINRLRRWMPLDGRREVSTFPEELGIKGNHGVPIEVDVAYTLAEVGGMLLTNREAAETVPERHPSFTDFFSGFAWHQGFFVGHTPSYSLTVLGSSPGRDPQASLLGFGIPCTGGEFVLTTPGQEYLTPLSVGARNSFRAEFATAAGRFKVSSGEVTLEKREEYGFTMRLLTPDGVAVEKGEPFGPPPVALSVSEPLVEISYGHGTVTLTRRLKLLKDRVVLEDSLVAGEGGEIWGAWTDIPIITYSPQGLIPDLLIQSAGTLHTFTLPLNPNHQTEFSNVSFLLVDYGCYGMKIVPISGSPRLEVTRGEWCEHVLMDARGKTLGFQWAGTRGPEKMRPGEKRSFTVELFPYEVVRIECDEVKVLPHPFKPELKTSFQARNIRIAVSRAAGETTGRAELSVSQAINLVKHPVDP